MSVKTVIFLSLILDLFAFTIPLPLFPRIVEWYTQREAHDKTGLLSRSLQAVSFLRSFFRSSKLDTKRWDVVLLGGFMGSLFSALQFLVSPHIGSLSDKYGRKPVLLVTMIGNILSALIWVQSTSWSSYLLSRAVGGLSEGNVQLAIAILSDVTPAETRSRSLALVGLAFSICFCIGPPIGAYFSMHPFQFQSYLREGWELNIYATPALVTLVLLVVETLFLAFALPETRARVTSEAIQSTEKDAKASKKPSATKGNPVLSRLHRLSVLKQARGMHFNFLLAFSGVEFTLTFLTYDLFDWNNAKNGRLLAIVGIMSALLQGGYTRTATRKIGEGVMARRGMISCAISFLLLASLPSLDAIWAPRVIYVAAAFLAFTSATVVSSLTALASLQCDDDASTSEGSALAKGKALGQFRSSGQLGRAIGPLLSCAMYWTFGPSVTYSTAAAAMMALAVSMRQLTK
ncbi:Major facilitator superfamily domain-containing protein 10 AltName: Full=Tetracycline transporter-like protein [Serendipita indica DSM 11827]|uniref:Related to tetracycline resistance protein n=1 Tax=Serendipita indica (strain DSM 11827) TaxID=1109443 RepID=G4T5J2_SERID|nr:Major facilitator superfamily domain-containing protein 10 AltName: Full=Tetracycline transporter-like protein [Serendipita indica DSM 11827]CCA66619.1 related to tetracycline resistance protein [Serendipita indica DSM 11827]